MATDKLALGGQVSELFAGIAVSNLDASIDWYQRLFGSPPSFLPNDREAVWAIADNRWIYLIVDAARAGGSVQTVLCDGLGALINQISERGIDFSNEERPAANVRKVMYYDPDGNEFGIGSVGSE